MADALIENTCALGDCREIMRRWIDAGVRVQTCVTSPPYWGLRDYGIEGQLGLEETPEEYIANMVEVFRLVRDLLDDDGTLWLNLGDSYAASQYGSGGGWAKAPRPDGKMRNNRSLFSPRQLTHNLKPKDLVGIPWRVAFALQADGWYLRSDIIWAKPNPMPESVTDRPTKAHEYLFLLAKSARYYYDAEAVKTPSDRAGEICGTGPKSLSRGSALGGNISPSGNAVAGGYVVSPQLANRRTVWTIATQAYSKAHFATFPEKLVEPCILAGSRRGDLVLDPFLGSGTVARVALRLQRRWLGCELNPTYLTLQQGRTSWVPVELAL
jgi:DNA modification methylase